MSAFSLRPRAEEPLEPGTVRLGIEALALTSNNVTYAALGERAGYLSTFPAPPGFGRVPAWGFAVVEASAHEDVAVGSRYFGLLPMSTDLTVRPAPMGTGSFLDTSAHRSGLDDSYRRYRPAGEPDHLDPLRAVVQTIYPACLQLADHVTGMNADAGPMTVVLSSASSKTAIGTAERLAHEPGIRTHGLTSPVNIAFTAGLGVYDQVSAYDDLGSLATDGPAVFLDLTRNPDLVTSVHHLLGNRLRKTVLIGGTHSVEPLELPGLPEPERFFAPAQQALQRTKVGDLAYEQRLAAAEQQFLHRAAEWLRVDEQNGPAALQDAVRALLAGPQAPDVAIVVRPRPKAGPTLPA